MPDTILPSVGEVWTGPDFTEGVVTRDDEMCRLVGRNGCHAYVAQRSMALLWKRKRAAIDGVCACQAFACLAQGYVRNMQGQWFCGDHVPRNQLLLLPGESGLNARPYFKGMLSVCPICRSKFTEDPQYRMRHNPGLYIFHHKSCGGKWTYVWGQGTPQTGPLLVSDLQAAVDVMKTEEACAKVYVYLGASVRTVLARELGGKDHVRFPGATVESLELLGVNYALVAGPSTEALELVRVLVGETYQNIETEVFYSAVSVSFSDVVLEDEHGLSVTIPIGNVPQLFRKHVQKSAFERIMGDDDLV